MSYPATTQAYSSTQAQAPTQEPVSAVLAQAISQYQEVEKRLEGIRDRIENRNNLAKLDVPTPPPNGVLSQALGLRNLASRMLDRCNEIESLL